MPDQSESVIAFSAGADHTKGRTSFVIRNNIIFLPISSYFLTAQNTNIQYKTTKGEANRILFFSLLII